MPPSAFSAWAVQMLCVAFSRRMCCSRVCRARTKPRRPSTSIVSPAIRPGIRRICSSVRRRSRTTGRRKSRRLPSGWPSPTAMSTPQSPGVRRMPRAIGSQAATSRAPASWAISAIALEILDAAEEVRVLDEDRGGLVVDRLGEASRSVTPPAERAPPRPRPGSRSSRCGESHGCADEGPGRRRTGGASSRRSPGSRRRRRSTGPRTGRRSRAAGRSARSSPSGTRTSPAGRPGRSRAGTACTGSGTRSGRRSRRRSPARSGRTSRRRGSRSPIRRRRCGWRAIASARRPGLRESVGQLERAVEPDAGRHVEELLDRGDADLVEHLARSSSVTEV